MAQIHRAHLQPTERGQQELLEVGIDGAGNATPAFAQTGTDHACGQLATEPQQGVGPARYDHKLNTSDHAQGTNAKELHAHLPHMVHLSWKHTRNSKLEDEKTIRSLERDVTRKDLPGGSHLQRLYTPSPGAEVVSGPFTAPICHLIPVTHLCITESNVSMGAMHPRAPALPLNTTRQIRLHETHGMIHRFMPHGRIIYFGIDADSFKREAITRNITEQIENAALNLVRVLRGKDLGIAFAYTDGSSPRTFNIRYDVTLPANTVAQSFFPSDPREMWYLGISRDAVRSDGFKDHIFNIFAHEFALFLGLRHWNAGTDARERHESSMLWPGTRDGDRVSVMNTGVDLKQLDFSEEDFRVIREVYSAVNGDVLLDGRTIIDADPHSECHVA